MEERVIKWWRSDYWFLDNSYPADIFFQGISYPSVTHAMMGAQTENMDLKIQIAQAALLELKGFAEQIDTPYDGFQGPSTMRKLLDYKFGYSASLLEMSPAQAELAQRLIATGNKTLVYGNRACSMFWGDCDCPSHFQERGKNVLGGLLMGVRERLVEYVAKNVDLKQTCTCEKPSEAFFMYCMNNKLWLKPFCSECQAKVGIFLGRNAQGSVRRFEKDWVKEKVVNKIVVPQHHHSIRPDVFGTGRGGVFDEARWETGWSGHLGGLHRNNPIPQATEPPLPQNITFHLSGRIS